MYPFERFTEDAKKTLTLAQEEAERSHHSYIGTEHLLLGLLRLRDGVAHQALVEMGLEVGRLRETIKSILGRDERIILQQIIPTSRVKKVIEIAFEQSRRMGLTFVGSGHLLMAIALEGEGIAARVLEDMGANASKVVATVERLMREQPRGGEPETWPVPEPVSFTPETSGELQSNVEALVRLLRHPHIANLLRAKGLSDVEGLGARLGEPPQEVVQLRAQLRSLQGAESEIRKRLDRAEQDWLRGLTD